jgi:hypothetical protein
MLELPQSISHAISPARRRAFVHSSITLAEQFSNETLVPAHMASGD